MRQADILTATGLPETTVVGADGSRDATIPLLLILGKNSFQNRLLTAYLEQAMAQTCSIASHAVWEAPLQDAVDGPALALVDCFGYKATDLWIKMSMGGFPDPLSVPVALFNVVPGTDPHFEKQAIENQIRGVFYIDEPPECLSRGIARMLDGEIWYSRKTTSRVILEQQRYRSRTEAAEVMLTAREKEILVAIASGATNSDIAAELNISLHTVKTHIYNVYRKIDVCNRLEATLWVARYL